MFIKQKISAVLIMIGICISTGAYTNNKRQSSSPLMVKKPRVSYMGKCSWFRINHKAAINPKAKNYVAMRWDYDSLGKHWGISKRSEVKKKLKNCWVLVRNPTNNKSVWCRPADWGPAKWTGRTIDLEKKVMDILDCSTDDQLVTVLYEDKKT